jgi:glycosyltransferase involved in cell wall biosynthesis
VTPLPRCGLIVTTHEWPAALRRVLACVEAQTHPPDELLIADDGSGAETARVIAEHSQRARWPVRHLWQPHHGFRAARARNRAIAAASTEYLVLLDGDMLPGPEFLADHLAIARPGHYTQGVRVPLDMSATAAQLRDDATLPVPGTPGLAGRRAVYARRWPRASALLRRAGNALVAIKACNQGFWRSDLLEVNGFDEAFEGWGSEDKELCARLGHAGIRRQTLLLGGVAFHLEHPPAPRQRAEANRARWQDAKRTRRTRCERGVDAHLAEFAPGTEVPMR